MGRGRPKGSKNKPKQIKILGAAPPAKKPLVEKIIAAIKKDAENPTEDNIDYKREYTRLVKATRNVLNNITHKCVDLEHDGTWLLEVSLRSENKEKRYNKNTDPLFQLEYELGIIGNKYAPGV